MTEAPTDWVDAQLGARRTGPLELVRERTWGSVWTAATEAGPVWVKQAAPSTAFEVRLYPVLARHAPDHVLHPLAADAGRRLVLLPDAGPSFAQRFRDGALTAAMAAALAGYGAFQRRLAAAVADWGDAVLAHPFACLLTPMDTLPEDAADPVRPPAAGTRRPGVRFALRRPRLWPPCRRRGIAQVGP